MQPHERSIVLSTILSSRFSMQIPHTSPININLNKIELAVLYRNCIFWSFLHFNLLRDLYIQFSSCQIGYKSSTTLGK